MKKKYQTGSHHLSRKHFFNNKSQPDLDVDIPDGDVEVGKRLYEAYCSGCHALYENKSVGPKLHNIFGKTAGTQKGYTFYSRKNRALPYQWSRQRLDQLLREPEQVLGLLSNMNFDGLKDPYDRACVIEYLHYLRIHTSDLVKPEWINEQKK